MDDYKKKIIINASYCDRNPTGIGIFTKELVSNLVRMNPDNFFVLSLYDLITGYANKKILPQFLSPERGPSGHIARILWSQTMLGFEYVRNNGGLLFSTLPEAPIVIKNKVVVVHDIIPAKFPYLQPRMKYYFKYIVPKILKTALHLVFDSESTRRDVFDYYRLDDIPNSVIYPGYNRDIYYPMEKGFIKEKYGYDKYLIFVGDMRPYKNLLNAIRSFAAAELEDVLFVIAGRQDRRYFPEIKSIVKKLNLEERIVFADYVPIEDLPHFYRDSIALFFPSRYEGFGLPPLEAMATGTPVITTRMSSIPEVCGDAAIYVDPDNIDEMADVIKMLEKESSISESYSSACLQRASNFSWEKTSQEYIALLTGILDEI